MAKDLIFKENKNLYSAEDLEVISQLNQGSIARYLKKGTLKRKFKGRYKIFDFEQLVKARLIKLFQDGEIKPSFIYKILDDEKQLDEYQLVVVERNTGKFCFFSLEEFEQFKLDKDNTEIVPAKNITIDCSSGEAASFMALTYKSNKLLLTFEDCYIVFLKNVRKVLIDRIKSSDVFGKEEKLSEAPKVA